jgi:isoleucyl-tRNA synthetase
MEINFPKQEKRILKFWQDNQIFEKSIKQRQKARDFVFYEGPPTANGKPGIHHVLSRVFKDIICRYKTMRGFRVLRKAGWDTQGLPVELEIEKKLGLKNKKDIENYGIAKFNKQCRESVWQYLKVWEKLTQRIAYWIDLKNPYITYDNNYIESVWFIIKEIYKKGLLYQGHKVVPYCPRCGTTISYHEVAQGYQRIKENSIYVKFLVKNPEFPNTSLLVWTTTPWTLPGNVAVAVNPKIVYVKVKFQEENLILAKGRMEACGLKDAEILEEIAGEKILEVYYQAPYPVESMQGVTIYKVIPADFVSLEDGTGLVHIAPAFGVDDMEAIKEQNSVLKHQNLPDFPILLPVDEDGKFRLEAKKWAGIFVKEADPLIIADLKERNILFKEQLHEHDYPFCWRCKSPLLYYAKQSWFINMQEAKDNLIKNNRKINWVPAHLKEGRFGEWLKDVRDWALSRERYWGTPLPVWKCKSCNSLEVIGSKDDLARQKFSQNRYFIMRHGEALSNTTKTSSCWPESFLCPITKKGQLQVKKAAQKLKNRKIDFIFSSDLLRTKQTAEIIAKELNLSVKLDKRLREENVGVFNGRPVKEFGKYFNPEGKLSPREFYGMLFKSSPKKGENYLAMEKRMFDFMEDMESKYSGKTILIISHERPITLLEKILNGQTLEEFVNILVKKKDIKTGEARELEFKRFPYDDKMELDFHRPYIDEISFSCTKCRGKMERAPEVIDCWFDSGSMPFSQNHWPFDAAFTFAKTSADKQGKPQNGKLLPPKLFPADYISEAIDQTRGWFYTLLSISTLLGFESPYKNVISQGHVLDEKGEKMSKSKGNIVDPWYIIEKYGADSARWYFYTINQPGEPKLFSEKDIDSVLKRFILTFWNCFVFLETYGAKTISKPNPKNLSLLDKWIIAKLNDLVKKVQEFLEDYDVTSAARAIEKFTIDDLSLWYVRRSRRRFQKPKNDAELKTASAVLKEVLVSLSKVMAPFTPFLSEDLYQKLENRNYKKISSVHLQDWTDFNEKTIDKDLILDMEKAREIVTLALAERAKAAIKVRQPLAKLKIKKSKYKIGEEFFDLIKEEINVKGIIFDEAIKNDLELDTTITPELREEGNIREITRNIQEMRKKANLKPKNKISVMYSGDLGLEQMLQKNEKSVLEEGKIKDLQPSKDKKGKFLAENSIKVDGKDLWLAIKKK